MYRIFSFILLAVAMNAYADSRSLEQLRAIASQHFGGVERSKGNTHAASEIKMLKMNDELAVMGIDGKGFVVVAVDDTHEPILGYSDSEFPNEELNPALHWWMTNVQKALSLGNTSTAATTMPDDIPARVEPYCTALWNQSNPYNKFVPGYKSGSQVKNYPTGCVATAMSEAMYYYKYPEHGTGFVRNTFDGGEGEGAKFVTLQLDTIHLDWDNMLPVYKSGYTDAQADAVAWLMFASGTSVQMGYSPSGSGAYDDKCYIALVKHWGYSAAMPFYFRDMLSAKEWDNAIYTNIANHLPLITCGSNPNQGGHCFLLDGYDETGKVHVNWGWGHTGGNGFFDLSLLNGFSLQQSFFPLSYDMTGEHHSKFGMYHCGFDAMKADKTHLRMSISGYVYNIDPLIYTKDIYFVARDVNTGNDYLLATQSLGGKEIGYIETFQELYGISKQFVTIAKKIGDGTFNVFAATKSDEESQYQPIRAHENYNDCYIMQVVNGEIVSFEENKNGWFVPTGIENVELTPADRQQVPTSTFNLSGQRVNSSYRGIQISNGKKTVK